MLQVSVIIPTYNRADYLWQALQSIFNQSLEPDEIIIIDDGSTDNTAEIVSILDPKVRYIKQDHQGVAAARNHGLEVAQGEIIAWLDADDLWEPDFLATVMPFFDAVKNLDGVYTGLTRIDTYGNLLPQVSHGVVPSSELFSFLLEDCFIQTSTFVARKRCFEQVGNFDTQFDICEDYDMFLRLAKNFVLQGIPIPLVRYRIHPHNTVGDAAAFCRFRLALTEKHFGKPEGNPLSWSADKRRAHGCAFRKAALRCIEGGQADLGWRYFEEAVLIWPALLGRLDTFFELACGDQPMGYRGQAHLLDIEANGVDILGRLDKLFAKPQPDIQAMARPAYGNAYLALAILSDQAGRWSAARCYLLAAIRAYPALLTSYPVVRRLLKLYAGQRLVGALSRWRRTNKPIPSAQV